MMETFHDEAQRYEYPLTGDSVVLDAGCYHGTFSEGIHQRYGCHVRAFEPVKQYFEISQARLAGRTSISLFNFGVGPADARLPIAVAGDWSSLHLLDRTRVHEEVEIRNVDSVLDAPVDLMKINIEGAEYDLLDAMLDRGLLAYVKYLQVQFHTYGGGEVGAVARRLVIRERLKATHDEQWCSDFVWESWSRR
jgi:FkbM family methyltransferase